MTPQGIKPFEVELPLPVKSYDIDLAGVVSNITYIRWLEDLRLEMLNRYFPLEDQIREGYSPVVLETHIQYKKTIRMFERPIGRMWMSELEGLRGALEAEILVHGKAVAKATQICTFISLSNYHPIRIPTEFRALFEGFSKEGAGPDKKPA